MSFISGTVPSVSTNPVVVTAASQQTAPNTKYIAARDTSRVDLKLPAITDIKMGEQILVRGRGNGGWKVSQNAGQMIKGASNTTQGVGGYLQSQTSSDTVALEVTDIDTTNNTMTFLIISNRGTLDIV
jgi:hypothetical protein